MRFFFITVITCLATLAATAQQRTCLLYLKDKGPEQFSAHSLYGISPRAIERHRRYGIPLSETDLPVSATYRNVIQDSGLQIGFSSRWLNCVLVQTALTPEEIRTRFTFVVHVQVLPDAPVQPTARNKFVLPAPTAASAAFAPAVATSYGATETQNKQLHADCLHDQGYTGKNVLIAQFDTGFLGVDTISAYDSIYMENRMVATRNFVNPPLSVYSNDLHGSMVFSTMAGNRPGSFVGIATGASYALAITENLGSETHQEELNWLAAAEWADSLGADIIQSSLSYKTFDNGEGDYTDNLLDGKTAIITNAARMAAGKGILVVNSAGNDGNLPAPLSRRVAAPNDADSILSVGSVMSTGQYDPISSVGPTADGRIKPDVVAMGDNSSLLNNRGTVVQFGGTSFAAPLISGLAACLMQANPQRAWWEIQRAIVVSASQVNTPDNFKGFGIPNACRADSLLKTYNGVDHLNADALKSKLRVYPSPATRMVQLDVLDPSVKVSDVEVMDETGRVVPVELTTRMQGYVVLLDGLAPGMYLLRLRAAQVPVSFRLVKY